MDQDDAEKRIAELERRLGAARAAAGQTQSVQQPYPLSAAHAAAIAEDRARRRPLGRALGLESTAARIGFIIVAIIGSLGLVVGLGFGQASSFPSSALWTGAILCKSPYHLEFTGGYSHVGRSGTSVEFECVSGESSYEVNPFAVMGLQVLFVALVLAAVTAVGWLMWRRLGKRR